MSSPESRCLESGLLDALVERIARTISSTAVFVTAESPSTGVSLRAEFPPAAASKTLSARAREAVEGSWPDGQVVAVPVRSGDVAIGWAAAVGSTLGNDKEAEELVTLLAKCAAALVERRPIQLATAPVALWELAARDGYWEWEFASGVMRYSRQSLVLLDHRNVDRPDTPDVWFERIHPEDRASVLGTLLAAATSPRSPNDCEHRVVRRDGSVRQLVMRAMPECDDLGRPIRLVGWLSDVSRMRQVESELRRVQSLADVGRVAAGAAHDFNNFLTVIRGHTELALGLVKPDSALGESLELIKHAAAGATTLTKQLLTVQRRQTLVESVVDLSEVVAQLERTLRSIVGRTSRLVVNLSPHAGRVRAEVAHIHRLLINLVVNARDAMPKGGVVTIETERTSEQTLGTGAKPMLLPPGEYVTLTVRDTGSGMDDATRTRIFEPFFTTKPAGHGTGLGLWIVREVMERCGGVIDVRSTPGSGTEFVMYFPQPD